MRCLKISVFGLLELLYGKLAIWNSDAEIWRMAEDFKLKNVVVVASVIGGTVLILGLLGVLNTF